MLIVREGRREASTNFMERNNRRSLYRSNFQGAGWGCCRKTQHCHIRITRPSMERYLDQGAS